MSDKLPSQSTPKSEGSMTCREALLLLLDQVDFTVGACSMTDMVGQCVPKGVFEKCRAAIAAETSPRSETGALVPKETLLRWAERLRHRQEDAQVSIDMVEYEMRQMAKSDGSQWP